MISLGTRSQTNMCVKNYWKADKGNVRNENAKYV